MRVVLDANAVVSALLWNRKPRALLEAALRKDIELCASAEMLEELANVMPRAKLAEKVRASGFTAQELTLSYAQVVTLTVAAQLSQRVSVDPKDDHVLACALAAGADLIVSGDPDLLNLKTYHRIPIVGPAEALRRIEAL